MASLTVNITDLTDFPYV